MLRDKISTANNDDDLISIAKQAGFHPSTEDIWLYEDRNFKRKAALRGWYFHDLAHH
jgi:predicted ribosomally synthesized peptide with nif11-like leader